MTQANYDRLRDDLVAALRQDREARLRGDEDSIGRRYDGLDGWIHGHGTEVSNRLLEALCFWDYWMDARNHDRIAFNDIAQEQWLVLAEHVIASLASGRRIDDGRGVRLVSSITPPA